MLNAMSACSMGKTLFSLPVTNSTGTVIGNPTGNFGAIDYVRVRLVNYQIQLWIPFLNAAFSAPAFTVTLPRESLGIPRTGAVTPC